MIVQQTTKYSFPTTHKVHYFCPAYDNTAVVLVLSSVGKDSLMHLDGDKILYTYHFNDFEDTLCMPDDRHVLVLRPE